MKTGRNGARFPSFHAGHKQLSVGNKTVFFDAINSLVPWEFNGKVDGTDEVVDSIVEGATFTRPYRGGVEQQYLPPYEYHLIYDKMLTDFPLLDKSLLTLSDNPKEAINASQLKNASQQTKSSHFGYMVTDTYLAEQLLTTLATNNFPSHVLDQYVNRTMAWTEPYWMTSCTVQLYVLLPYNIIVEFDIAYYERYREKRPELNLPEALYWRGAHGEISPGESLAALSETPRTEFNTYLCNLTWNSTLGMTLEDAGLNHHTGPIVDNRNGHLHQRVVEDIARNSSFYEEALNDTDALIPLAQLESLAFDNDGISFAVVDSDLNGSYNCSYTISSARSSSDTPYLIRYGLLELFPTAKSSAIYTSSWSIGAEPKHVRGASSTCSGVAAKMPRGPQPEVFSVSIGLAGCSAGRVPSFGAGSIASTMLLQLKSKPAISATSPRRLHEEHLDGDSHYHDQAGEHEHHQYHEHSHDQLLLDGVWATRDGESYHLACVQQLEHAGQR